MIMAIIINEIEVSVEVDSGATGSTASGTTGSFDREEIIRECVEKVMEILNQKSER